MFIFYSTNYKLLFDVDVDESMSKADRFIVGESYASHPLIFSGVNLDRQERPISFCVENMRRLNKEKCFSTMSREWFSEFVFQIAIDKKFLSDDVLEVFEQEPISLPAWDPLGNLVT